MPGTFIRQQMIMMKPAICGTRQGKLAESKARFCRSLKIKENVGDSLSAAGDYHSGRVAALQDELDEAKNYHENTIEIYEKAGLITYAADVLYKLRLVAVEKGHVGEEMAF